MRDIKFRGKRVDNGEWAYGSLLYTKNGSNYILPEDAKLLTQVIEVKPETVGQYTGLKDKNGTEIYEGDIIKSVSDRVRISDNTKTGEVCTSYYRIGWHKSGCWNKFDHLTDEHTGITGITLSCLKYYEVIGNIYQHPDLLK